MLRSFVEKSAAKLAEDASYRENGIKSFNEKFYPQFYKAFISAENLYKNLSGNCGLLLSFEVANHVLAQLTGETIQEDVLTYDMDEAENCSGKNLFLLSYLGGYVFGTFY